MRLLRPRDGCAVFGSYLTSVAVFLCLAIAPGALASGLDLQSSRTGLPSSWLGEALMVALAFALPAIMAGTALALQKLFRRTEQRDAFRSRQ